MLQAVGRYGEWIQTSRSSKLHKLASTKALPETLSEVIETSSGAWSWRRKEYKSPAGETRAAALKLKNGKQLVFRQHLTLLYYGCVKFNAFVHWSTTLGFGFFCLVFFSYYDSGHARGSFCFPLLPFAFLQGFASFISFPIVPYTLPCLPFLPSSLPRRQNWIS